MSREVIRELIWGNVPRQMKRAGIRGNQILPASERENPERVRRVKVEISNSSGILVFRRLNVAKRKNHKGRPE